MNSIFFYRKKILGNTQLQYLDLHEASYVLFSLIHYKSRNLENLRGLWEKVKSCSLFSYWSMTTSWHWFLWLKPACRQSYCWSSGCSWPEITTSTTYFHNSSLPTNFMYFLDYFFSSKFQRSLSKEINMPGISYPIHPCSPWFYLAFSKVSTFSRTCLSTFTCEITSCSLMSSPKL